MMEESMDTYECRDWRATFSRSSRALDVSGVCTFPQGGYTARLSANVNQGTNWRDALRLKIEAEPPDGGPDVLTDERVTYHDDDVGEEPPWPRVVIANATPPASIDIEHVE